MELNPLRIDLADISLKGNFNSIDITKIKRLTQSEYDQLQLAKVESLEGYGCNDLSTGQTLLKNENGKIITIQIISDGEVSEYLLSYDRNGNLVDNLIVAYEDMVEYYSEVSSRINANEITVQTINYTYDEMDEDTDGRADTAVVRYKITPEFKFIND